MHEVKLVEIGKFLVPCVVAGGQFCLWWCILEQGHVCPSVWQDSEDGNSVAFSKWGWNEGCSSVHYHIMHNCRTILKLDPAERNALGVYLPRWATRCGENLNLGLI